MLVVHVVPYVLLELSVGCSVLTAVLPGAWVELPGGRSGSGSGAGTHRPVKVLRTPRRIRGGGLSHGPPVPHVRSRPERASWSQRLLRRVLGLERGSAVAVARVGVLGSVRSWVRAETRLHGGSAGGVRLLGAFLRHVHGRGWVGRESSGVDLAHLHGPGSHHVSSMHHGVHGDVRHGHGAVSALLAVPGVVLLPAGHLAELAAAFLESDDTGRRGGRRRRRCDHRGRAQSVPLLVLLSAAPVTDARTTSVHSAPRLRNAITTNPEKIHQVNYGERTAYTGCLFSRDCLSLVWHVFNGTLARFFDCW